MVLSLPERVWTPDIVWEKDSDDSDKDEDTPPPAENAEGNVARKMSDSSDVAVVESSDAALADHEGEGTDTAGESHKQPQPAKKATRKRDKTRRKSKTTKRYYSKDECAICMDNFHRGEIVRILPCGHVFHKDECDEWLLKWRKLVSETATWNGVCHRSGTRWAIPHCSEVYGVGCNGSVTGCGECPSCRRNSGHPDPTPRVTRCNKRPLPAGKY